MPGLLEKLRENERRIDDRAESPFLRALREYPEHAAEETPQSTQQSTVRPTRLIGGSVPVDIPKEKPVKMEGDP